VAAAEAGTDGAEPAQVDAVAVAATDHNGTEAAAEAPTKKPRAKKAVAAVKDGAAGADTKTKTRVKASASSAKAAEPADAPEPVAAAAAPAVKKPRAKKATKTASADEEASS
jgi:hypothetical protein